MRSSTRLHLLLGALCLWSAQLHAERGELIADGILIVRGADEESAVITVVPENAAAYTFSGTRRFTLRLPMNDTYLVSFVREGCPTKEVFFDTRVPAQHTHADFDFPFQVTLAHLNPDEMFMYEGPVGFVRYQDPIADFGYETRYVVKVNEELYDRMKAMEVTGTDPKTIPAPVAAGEGDIPKGESEPVVETTPLTVEGDVAPKVSEVPELVHTVSGPMVTEEEMVPVNEEVLAPTTTREEHALPATADPGTTTRMHAVTRNVVAERTTAAVATAAPVPLSEHAEKKSTPTLVAAPTTTSEAIRREEEVLVEPRMVIHVVRFIRPDGSVTDELRSVAHAYGAVFFFHNAQSITERMFLELAAEM